MSNLWLERELEDYLVANPMDIGREMHDVVPNGNAFVFLGRQIKCTVGIIDLLFHASTTLFVVELKAVRATSRDLGQVLRYSDYIRSNLTWFTYFHQGSPLNALIPDFVNSSNVSIEPVLVAPSFDHTAAYLTDVHTFTATKTDTGFEIEVKWLHKPAFDDGQLISALSPYIDEIRSDCELKAKFDAERDAQLSVERRLTDTN